ncbi:MAG: 3-methyl-2-oxobutanoate hydroxymethyltransferase, partial [Candidatus Thermoplasmatota archaeon]|nr:3-methyl-2-oxobutanoate hydroxymethyltransferase [Candidatus Thermoplasmatota archaeon]
VRATEDHEAATLSSEALARPAAGCFAIVLEKIPAELAKMVSEKVNIPTIGIGAGPHCDGQVLVLHDMLGITKDFSPRFLRRYADLGDAIDNAVKQYITDVRSGDFPNEEESY